MTFVRWLFSLFRPQNHLATVGSVPASQSTEILSNTPIMSQAVRALQAVKPRIVSIRFPDRRKGGSSLSSQVSSVSESPEPKLTDKQGTQLAQKGTGIEDHLLPKKLRRQLPTKEEIEYINGSFGK